MLSLRRQRILGILLQKSLKFFLGHLGLGAVAVRLRDLLVVRIGYLQLRVGRFRQEREENPKVLISLDRLSQPGRSALFIIGVRNRQLRLGQILAVRIRVDQRLHAQTPDLLPPFADIL